MGLTASQEERLIEEIARALSWHEEPGKNHKREVARGIVNELSRGANGGNAIQLKQAIDRLVERKSA